MDLTTELLEVLNNPTRVWHAVVTNLANEPRLSLLVFATCTTPINLVGWQEAVARISAEAAVRFEAALRVLDDSFVETYREELLPWGKRDPGYMVKFRNPSMDDFCAAYLDSNVGIASNIASREPALHQIRRLIELGSARATDELNETNQYRRRYPNIYEALISNPTILLSRLFSMMPSDTLLTNRQAEIITVILTLLSQARNINDGDFSAARARIKPLLRDLGFDNSHNSFLYTNLDNAPRVRILSRLLGDQYEDFYEVLCGTAEDADHFDTLMNLDSALGRDPENVEWASHFKQRAELWLDEDMDSDTIYRTRAIYEHIFDYLQLPTEESDQSAWDERFDEAVRQESDNKESEDEDEDDDSWRESSSSSNLADLRETRHIASMFNGLRDIDR